MKKYNKPAALAQAPAVANQELFMTLLRDSLRTVAEQMLLEEVAALCGPSHYPLSGATYRRAGSESGTCHAGGRREAIIRPRVRKLAGDGTEVEHVLASYAAMRTPRAEKGSGFVVCGKAASPTGHDLQVYPAAERRGGAGERGERD